MDNANELAQNVGTKKETMTRLTPDLYAHLTSTYQSYRNNEYIHTVATIPAKANSEQRPKKRPSRLAARDND